MINTILFDLDGTLLPMDTDEFIKEYFMRMAEKLDGMLTKDEVVKVLWGSSSKMIESNDGSKTNEEIFFEEFFSKVDVDEDIIMPILHDFYAKEYNLIQRVTSQNDHIIEAVDVLKRKGYDVAIATNPLFPEPAVAARIQWAGLDIDDFSLVTTFEHMHYTKPNINYYKEVLQDVNKDAKHCLMVGNNIDEDMIAKEIGISTYLITDYVMGDINEDHNIDHSGDYKEFLGFVNNLPDIN